MTVPPRSPQASGRDSALAGEVCLWVSLTLPSLFVVQKLLGWLGAALYVASAAVLVNLFARLDWPPSERRARWLSIVTLTAVVILVLVAHPLVNSAIPGSGSDDDDAYDAGARALLSGRSPYEERTYLGNQLHQLPGAFVLAAPFVLLGTSALQNPFWLAAFFGVVARAAGERYALRLAWLVLIASPTVVHQLVTGTGHAANAIYVVCGLAWVTLSRGSVAASVFCGVALASRANFVLLWPLAAGWLFQHAGSRTALRSTAVAAATFLVLTVPFYLHNPQAFGPLEAADRLTRFDAVLPRAGLAIGAATLGAALLLAARPMGWPSLFARCASVQAIPVVAGLAAGTVRDGWPDLAYATYGTFFTWFALLALAALYQSDHDNGR